MKREGNDETNKGRQDNNDQRHPLCACPCRSTWLAMPPPFISSFSFPTRRTMKRTMGCFFHKKVPSSVSSPAPAPAPPIPSPFASQCHHHGWSENRLPWALAGTNDPPPGEPPPKKAKKVGKRTRAREDVRQQLQHCQRRKGDGKRDEEHEG
jgi:hypothetical protein